MSARLRRGLAWSVVGFVLSIAGGCGGPAGPTTPQAEIHGIATLDDKPVPPDTTVTFWSAEEGGGGAGVCDASGKFSIKAANKERGLPAGKYKVAVTPKAVAMNTASDEYQKKMMSQMQPAGAAGGAEAPATPPPDGGIPLMYQDPEKSGLAFTVNVGANDIPIKLVKGQ